MQYEVINVLLKVKRALWEQTQGTLQHPAKSLALAGCNARAAGRCTISSAALWKLCGVSAEAGVLHSKRVRLAVCGCVFVGGGAYILHTAY